MPGKAYIEGKELQDLVEKFEGEPPVRDTVVANWNTGVASSGGAGADLCYIGAANTRTKVLSLLISMRYLSVGANVNIRMYHSINEVEDEVYNQTFIQGTDPDGLWIINGTLGIHDVLRVEVSSDNAADDGGAVLYDYMLEAMQ